MTDIFGDVPLLGQRAGIAEPLLGELAAQMLEQPQPDEDHDEPALASGGTIQSDLDQGLSNQTVQPIQFRLGLGRIFIEMINIAQEPSRVANPVNC
jgi:hypothetical protein